MSPIRKIEERKAEKGPEGTILKEGKENNEKTQKT